MIQDIFPHKLHNEFIPGMEAEGQGFTFIWGW